MTAIFVAFQQGGSGFAGDWTANSDQVFSRHEFWRAFTAPLVHADIEHLGSNALFFTGLAYLLNAYFGFWIFPVLSFFAGGLINLIVLPFYPPEVSILGASGIVYFMAAFWLTLDSLIERGVSRCRRLANVSALTLVLLVPEVLQERVSYSSHAAGFVLGIGMGLLFFALNRRKIRFHELWKPTEPEDPEGPSAACSIEETA